MPTVKNPKGFSKGQKKKKKKEKEMKLKIFNVGGLDPFLDDSLIDLVTQTISGFGVTVDVVYLKDLNFEHTNF